MSDVPGWWPERPRKATIAAAVRGELERLVGPIDARLLPDPNGRYAWLGWTSGPCLTRAAEAVLPRWEISSGSVTVIEAPAIDGYRVILSRTPTLEEILAALRPDGPTPDPDSEISLRDWHSLYVDSDQADPALTALWNQVFDDFGIYSAMSRLADEPAADAVGLLLEASVWKRVHSLHRTL